MHYPNFLHKSIIFIFLLCNGAASRASFGEKCSKELRCESRNFLTCSPTENTCVCLMPDTMTFEGSSKKCVALAGERCQYTALEGERTWSDEIPCISKAACVDGMCECISNYFEMANGTCHQKRTIGRNCSSDPMCSSEKHLTCGPEQTCVCKDNRVLVDGVCRLKAGGACRPNDNTYNNCVYNSYCSSSSYGHQCKCQPQYFASSTTGLCELKRSFGKPCTNDSQCDETKLLRCNRITKSCDCKNGFGYNPQQQGCKNSPNAGQCSRDSECVPNSRCFSDRKCHCKSGSIPFDKYCLVAENDPCDGDVRDENVIVRAIITDKTCVPGLVCRNSRCSCLYKDHQVYNESSTGTKCVSLLGGPCNDTRDCALNSECVPNRVGLMECQCMEGFIQAGRRCDIAFGQKCRQCDVNSRCDRYGPLECSVRGICECSDFQIYESETLKCRGLAGAACEIRENPQPFYGTERGRHGFCVDGAKCKLFRGVKSGLCSCEDENFLQKDRTCNLPELLTATPTTISRTTTGAIHIY